MRSKTQKITKINKFAREYFDGLKAVLEKLHYEELEDLVGVIWKAYRNGKTIFFLGNGGSASTATHLAADIGKNTVVDYKDEDEDRFRTLALTDNVAWMTALGNDISYEDIFVEQLKNFLQKGDVVVVISGSGNSANVIKAIDYANGEGAITVGLLGFNGGKAERKVRLSVRVPANHYGYVEGIHSEIHHFLVEALKKLKSEE